MPPSKASADICIIGAGSSGMAVAKALQDRGLVFDCFEKGSQIGGMWRYENDNGLSSAYACLHIDTSRENLGYSDFPIPADKPDFLSHVDFLAHLEAYADRFDLRRHVHFKSTVTSLAPIAGSGWAVTTDDSVTRHYRSVVVANGHLWDPRLPRFEGEFSGTQIHSHHYRTASPYEGQDVLVVGLGNSAVDIAVDLCRRARSVTISTRRSAWIMPKYLMGIPIDRWSAFFARKLHLSTRVTRMIMSRLARLAVGDQRRFGVRRPPHPMWREHATLSQDLLPAIGHGRIRIRPNVARLDGDSVAFVDGTLEHFDSIVFATGYKTTFPFLDPVVFNADEAPVRLYRRILAPDHPGLYFAGLVQPIGPTIPLVEVQAKWIAAVLAGQIDLPGSAEMDQEIATHRRFQTDTFLESDRYVLEVDYKMYSRQLRRDLAPSK